MPKTAAACSYPQLDQLTPKKKAKLIFFRSVSILCCYLSLGAPSLFPRQNPVGSFLSYVRAKCPSYFIPLDLITQLITGKEEKSRRSDAGKLNGDTKSEFRGFPQFLGQ